MVEPTTRPGIDPVMQALLDAFPFTFTADQGVEVAREQMRQMKAPAELLPEMRIEERTIAYGDVADLPVRIYWPPVAQHDNLPIVVFYHGGGWAIGDLDTHDPVAARMPSAPRRSWCRWTIGSRRSIRTRRASTTLGRRCNGSASMRPSSAATRNASPSPATRRAATSRR